MASFNRSNQKSAGMIVGVVIFAAAAWGMYAWKYAKTPVPVTGSDMQLVDQTEPAETDVGDNESARSRPEADSSIQANAPSTNDSEAKEIELSTSPEAAAESTGKPPSPFAPASFGNSAAKALMTGREALASGELIKARAAMSRALALGVSTSDQDFVRRELDRISDAMLFSRAVSAEDPLTVSYTVKSGESLYVIAAKHKISQELVMTLNGIRDRDAIYAGSKLKLIQGPFSAKVYKSAHRMDIFLDDVFVRSFSVGLGTDGGTPAGEWIIKSKITDPDWSDPVTGRYYSAADPENPIGERWVSLECISGDCMGRIGFGIHGTIDPKSIGADLSMGCVRLAPDDVAFVFDLFVQRHSKITVLP